MTTQQHIVNPAFERALAQLEAAQDAVVEAMNLLAQWAGDDILVVEGMCRVADLQLDRAIELLETTL
jgi:hypothetical protein